MRLLYVTPRQAEYMGGKYSRKGYSFAVYSYPWIAELVMVLWKG